VIDQAIEGAVGGLEFDVSSVSPPSRQKDEGGRSGGSKKFLLHRDWGAHCFHGRGFCG
jgi:hypothetical protein